MLWAWERPEDLTFIDTKEFGVAFLAQTLTLEGQQTRVQMRRQPLQLPDGVYLIAVTRIETVKRSDHRPYLNDERIAEIIDAVLRTAADPNVRGVQIDFDAVESERPFYRKLMFALRQKLDESEAQHSETDNSQLTAHRYLLMTSLASWCTGDAWFNDFPVAEAVPMAFQMGADSEKIRTYLRNGNDWQEPLCRGSYGISLDEGMLDGMKPDRRIYYFKNTAWKAGDIPN